MQRVGFQPKNIIKLFGWLQAPAMIEIDRMQIEARNRKRFAGTGTTFWCSHSVAIGEESAVEEFHKPDVSSMWSCGETR